MKSPRAALVTAAIALLLTSLPATAGELPFNPLASAHAESASNEPGKFHWSAAIGTGHAASAVVTTPKSTSNDTTNASATGAFHGVPASPHWTARVGTGTAAASTITLADAEKPSSSGKHPVVTAVHWTSRIGTGHASDSSSPVTHASLADRR